MTGRRNRQRGNALAMVLIVGVLVTLTAAITLNVTGYRWRASALDMQRLQAFAAAEAGMQEVIARLTTGAKLPSPPTPNPCDGKPLFDGTWDTLNECAAYRVAEAINGKQVTITITYLGPTADRRFKITATTSG